MGVFTVGRQVALEIDMPGWWLANASVDMDFRCARYYDSSTANPRSATNFLSCSRASIGYAKKAAGTLTQFANDTLRIGVGTGLLVEYARTNICLYSSAMDNTSGWSPVAEMSITTGSSDPAGGTTAYAATENSAATTEHKFQTFVGFNITSGTARPFTLSFYLKRNGRNFLVNFYDSGINGFRFEIDTSAWTSTTTAIGSGWTNSAFSVETLANGWNRVSLTGTCATSTSSLNIECKLSNSPGNTNYTGDGTSGVYIWGPQIEEASFASSYIPTTTSSAVRAADSVSFIGNLDALLKAAQSSMIADYNVIPGADAGAVRNIIQDQNNNILFRGDGVDVDRVNTESTGVSLSNALFVTKTYFTGVKLGLASNASGRSLVGDGGTVKSDATPSAPISTIFFGAGGGGLASFNNFRRLTVWNSRLADATLQALTAP